MERDEEMLMLGKMSEQLDFLVSRSKLQDLKVEEMEERLRGMDKKILIVGLASLGGSSSSVWFPPVLKLIMG